MTSECEELHNIAVSIVNTSKVNVIIDNTLDTAYTDFKNIFVTVQLIPPELRTFKRVVSRVLDGEVSHEGGHMVITAPVKQRLMQWEKTRPNSQLATIVHQTLEDARVDYYILQRYRFDYAFRLQLLADVSNRLWIDTLKMQIAKERNDNAAYTMKPESFFLANKLIGIAGIMAHSHGVGVDVEKEFDLSEEQKEFLRKSALILDDARFDRMVMSVVNRHQQLYDYWDSQMSKSGESPEDTCPASVGGKMKLMSGQATRKMLQKMEKKMKEAEEKAQREEEQQKKKDENKTMAIGSGSGLNIPTPVPDEDEYIRLAQRNREHVERLLNLLKKLATPKLSVERRLTQGRFMTEILGKAYTSSLRRDVSDVYSRKIVKLEKTEACIGLLVDLSGSVNIEVAKNALTIISEVCGRWLRDEDFAILTFGSEYQKIKAYVEPYHTTRIRIGGLTCLGGTVLYAPLNELYQMMKAQRNNREKILIIASDFYVEEPEKCTKLIEHIEKDGIHVIGLGIDNTNERHIKEFTPRARYIGNISELPEAVFDLYKGVAF